jgi:hypothetical protein
MQGHRLMVVHVALTVSHAVSLVTAAASVGGGFAGHAAVCGCACVDPLQQAARGAPVTDEVPQGICRDSSMKQTGWASLVGARAGVIVLAVASGSFWSDFLQEWSGLWSAVKLSAWQEEEWYNLVGCLLDALHCELCNERVSLLRQVFCVLLSTWLSGCGYQSVTATHSVGLCCPWLFPI